MNYTEQDQENISIIEKMLRGIQNEGDLKRATVELAKDWRMDKMLRHLDAMLVVMDKKNSFIIAGDGNVIEPDSQIVSIGSGGGYAQAAATAFLKSSTFSPLPNFSEAFAKLIIGLV